MTRNEVLLTVALLAALLLGAIVRQYRQAHAPAKAAHENRPTRAAE
jgi:hypothetical protein